MRAVSVLALLAALALGIGCTGDISDQMGSDGGGGGDFDAGQNNQGEPPGLVGITNAHNVVRATVGVAPLVWDPDLAVVAQSWADQCIDNVAPIGLIDHNDGRSDNYPGYVGENIYGSGGTPSAQQAVDLWASEEPDYDYDSNTCSGVCGHYTQVVWATSLRLGCGVSTCQGLQFGGSIVCNYSPGGNDGGRPY